MPDSIYYRGGDLLEKVIDDLVLLIIWPVACLYTFRIHMRASQFVEEAKQKNMVSSAKSR
ncbi:unnamed protein product [Brassica oleracea var. botrytis]